MVDKIATLQDGLGYSFNEEKLLKAALTHRSSRGENNERLEFLGDSIINFVIAEELYHRQPKAKEGELSRFRSSLVKGETLAEIAKELDIGSYLRLGSGELKTGGHRRSSILADALEAVIAAIYLDADFEVCRNCILTWFAERLDNLASVTSLKDPKTRLQEHLQSKRLELPRYDVLSVEGEAHNQSFTVECVVEALDKQAQGQGASRRKAEQAAAKKLLEAIKK